MREGGVAPRPHTCARIASCASFGIGSSGCASGSTSASVTAQWVAAHVETPQRSAIEDARWNAPELALLQVQLDEKLKLIKTRVTDRGGGARSMREIDKVVGAEIQRYDL